MYMGIRATSSAIFEEARFEALGSDILLARVRHNVRLERCPVHAEPARVALDTSQKFIRIGGCCETFRRRVTALLFEKHL